MARLSYLLFLEELERQRQAVFSEALSSVGP